MAKRPRIRDAAASVEAAGHISAEILREIQANGLTIGLHGPGELKAKLADIPWIGPKLVPFIDIIDGLEINVRLGKPDKT